MRRRTGSHRASESRDPVILRFEGPGLGFVSHSWIFDLTERRVRHCRTFLRLATEAHPDEIPLGELRGFRLRPMSQPAHPLREVQFLLEYFDARYRAHTLGRVGLSALLPVIERVDRVAEAIGRPFLVPRSFLETASEGVPAAAPTWWLSRTLRGWLSGFQSGAALQNIRSRLAHSRCARSLP